MTSEHWTIAVLSAYAIYITDLHVWSGHKLLVQLSGEWTKVRNLEEEIRRQKMLRRLGTPWKEEESNS